MLAVDPVAARLSRIALLSLDLRSEHVDNGFQQQVGNLLGVWTLRRRRLHWFYLLSLARIRVFVLVATFAVVHVQLFSALVGIENRGGDQLVDALDLRSEIDAHQNVAQE